MPTPESPINTILGLKLETSVPSIVTVGEGMKRVRVQLKKIHCGVTDEIQRESSFERSAWCYARLLSFHDSHPKFEVGHFSERYIQFQNILKRISDV